MDGGEARVTKKCSTRSSVKPCIRAITVAYHGPNSSSIVHSPSQTLCYTFSLSPLSPVHRPSSIVHRPLVTVHIGIRQTDGRPARGIENDVGEHSEDLRQQVGCEHLCRRAVRYYSALVQ